MNQTFVYLLKFCCVALLYVLLAIDHRRKSITYSISLNGDFFRVNQTMVKI